jgi:hypothetical protein
MKRLAILFVLFVLPLGCKKAMDKISDDAKLQPDEKPQIIPKGGGDLTSGSGGATQGVRNAAARTVNDVALKNLHDAISISESVDGAMPTADAIKKDKAVTQDKQLVGLINDEVIILTGAKNKDGIWAYTQWPQRAGEHYIIKASGRDSMPAAELEKALKAQGSPVKLQK